MQSIQIGACLDDEAKLLERAPSLRPSGFVGCQVPGNDHRSAWGLKGENSATPQVSSWIDDRPAVGFEVRIPAFREFGRGTGGVTGIAMVQDVYVVAAKSY